MHYSEKFDPGWGYLSPAPSFIHTTRVVLVATAIGAIAGGSVVFSLAGHPASETAIALRTLAQSIEPFGTLARLPQAEVSQGSSQITALADDSARGPAPPSTGGPSEKTALEPPLNAADAPAASPEQVTKRAMKKPNVTSHYAWRGGYYSDGGRWGGYDGDRGWRYRDAW